jgi:hypothetical protein
MVELRSTKTENVVSYPGAWLPDGTFFIQKIPVWVVLFWRVLEIKCWYVSRPFWNIFTAILIIWYIACLGMLYPDKSGNPAQK